MIVIAKKMITIQRVDVSFGSILKLGALGGYSTLNNPKFYLLSKYSMKMFVT